MALVGPYIARGLNRLDFFIVSTAVFGYAVEAYMKIEGVADFEHMNAVRVHPCHVHCIPLRP